MNLNKFAAGMLSPPKEESDLLVNSFLILQVTLTAEVHYQRAGNKANQTLMRFSTHTGDAVWAEGNGTIFIYGHPCETLNLQVHVSHEGLHAVRSFVLAEPNGLTLLDLHPISEDIIDCLPTGVADEIRQNQLGKFAGDTS